MPRRLISALSLASLLLALPASSFANDPPNTGPGALGMGEDPGTVAPVDATSQDRARQDPNNSQFWWPADRLEGEQPLAQPTDWNAKETPADMKAWSGSLWDTSDLRLAINPGANNLSPFEKYDSFYANQNAEGPEGIEAALHQGTNSQLKGAALWEAHPVNKHNFANVAAHEGNTFQRYEEDFVRVRPNEIQIREGEAAAPDLPAAWGRAQRQPNAAVEASGETIPAILSRGNADDGTPVDIYWIPEVVGSEVKWGRIVRWPSEQSPSAGGEVRWTRLTHDSSGQPQVETIQASRGTLPGAGGASGGNPVLVYGEREYVSFNTFTSRDREGRTGEYFFYRPTHLPEIEGDPRTPATMDGYFARYPPRPAPAQFWYVKVWSVVGVTGDPSGYDGHCNGFSAASVLFKVPPGPKTLPLRHSKIVKLSVDDPRHTHPARLRNVVEDGPAQIEFTIDDQKGLMSELAMKVGVTFDTAGRTDVGEEGRSTFGIQAGSQDAQDSQAFMDIAPHHFHRIMLEYIWEKQRAVVVERNAGGDVWNSPTYGYEWKINRVNERQKKYVMSAKIHYANYGRLDNSTATIPASKDYTFELTMDDQNRITGGNWTGSSVRTHPDFIFVPVVLADPQHSGHRISPNPNLDRDFILREILTDAEGQPLLRSFQ